MRDADFSNERKILTNAHTADWAAGGTAVTAIEQDPDARRQEGYRVLRYELATGEVSLLHDSRNAGFNGYPLAQAAELHPAGRYLLTFTLHGTNGDRHHTYITDLVDARHVYNDQMWRGDCSPGWSPDGAYLTTTARTSTRPVLRAVFDASDGSLATSEHFAGMQTSQGYYIHGHRVSNDAAWLVGGVLWRSGALSGNREIYLWRVDDPGRDEHAVRLTFDTEEDHGPSLFVGGGGESVTMAVSPASLAFSTPPGGAPPDDKVVSVTHSGTGNPASLDVHEEADWLAVTIDESTNPRRLINAVEPGSLAPGVYTKTVSVSCDNATNSPLTYTVTLTVVAMRAADEVAEVRPGLQVLTYETGTLDSLPDFSLINPTRQDTVPAIDFDATSGPLVEGGPADGVACVFTGFFEALSDDVYTFEVESDDGSGLHIGTIRVVDNDGIHGMRRQSGTLGLHAGLHPIRIEYFDAADQAGLILRYARGDDDLRVVPDSLLWRAPLGEPSFSILRPGGGERWVAGTVETIEWTGTNVQEAVIEFSADNGRNWVEDIWPIQYGTEQWGACEWAVPDVSSDECRIRVATYQDEGTVISEVFSIVPAQSRVEPKSVTVQRPLTVTVRRTAGQTLITVGCPGDPPRLEVFTLAGKRIPGTLARVNRRVCWRGGFTGMAIVRVVSRTESRMVPVWVR
jgi:hypothetical protein